MLTHPRRPLIAAVVLTLVAGLSVVLASVSQAVGTSSPAILSPSTSSPQYAGFSGPFEVDFSDSPAGAYTYQVTDTGGDPVTASQGHTSSGSETANLRTSALPAGSYVFRVTNVAGDVPAATSPFTVRAGARPTCSVSLPRAVRVNSGQEIVTGKLAASCAAAHVTYAGWDVRHSSGAFHDLLTYDHTTRDSFSFFGADRLGIYVVSPSGASNPAADDIRQNTARIDVRLDSRLRLSAKRVRKNVTLTATLTKFVRGPRTFGSWKARRVTLSYRTCGACAWHLVRTRTTNARGMTTFRARAAKPRGYRVTSAGTSVIWAPNAGYVRR